MEQTSHTPDFTAAELKALRRHIHTRLVVQAEAMLRLLEAREAPQTALEITRHANAAMAVAKLVDRLIPAEDDETGEAEMPALAPIAAKADAPDLPPVVLNRHQRRKAEAKARRTGGAAPKVRASGTTG